MQCVMCNSIKYMYFYCIINISHKWKDSMFASETQKKLYKKLKGIKASL